MKKSLIFIVLCSFFILALTGCNKNQGQSQNQTQNQSQTQSNAQPQKASNTPDKAVSDFLKDLQHQDYFSAKENYTEDLDNMAQFHNQIETISPAIANKLFEKLADFTYEIESTSIDPNDPSTATVYLTLTFYDAGKAFESMVLEYIENDISMTYDGKSDDDIVKKADEIITDELEDCPKITRSHIPVTVTLDGDAWKVEKMSENPELLNIVCGNILETINKLTLTLEQN